MSELLADHQLYHSEFQADFFITIRSGGTLYGCYKQALRELFKRQRGLEELSTARHTLTLDIEELRHKASRWFVGRFQRRRLQIELDSKLAAEKHLDRNILETEREFSVFLGQATALKAEIGEITQERRAQLDAEMWAHKLKAMAAVDFLSCGRLKENTVEMLQSMPMEMRRGVCEQLKPQNQNALIEWFFSHEIALRPLIESDVRGRISESQAA